MNRQFQESKLNSTFSSVLTQKIKGLIESSVSFTLSGMSGVGGSFFLRFLSLQPFANFVYIDTYQLAEVNRLNYYQLILKELGETKNYLTEQEVMERCRERISELIESPKKLVLILNRFDQLTEQYSNQLFADLISLRNVSPEKVVFIFTSKRPFSEMLFDNITGDKINLFATTVYIKPYSAADIKQLLSLLGNSSWHSQESIDKAISLSGGHIQLLQLLLKSEQLVPPFMDQFVIYQLRELYSFLNYNQKKIVKKIAQGKQFGEMDPYLINIGMVNKIDEEYQLFSPLLRHFLIQENSIRMTDKERKLFRLLKQHLGKIVLKEQIFEYVWGENLEEASDWALTSLIYRLRKHSQVASQNYIIESHKKIGYLMIKS